MKSGQGYFKLLLCTQGKNVDFIPVSVESVPSSLTHTNTYTQVQGGEDHCAGNTLEFRKSGALMTLLSWL